MVGGLVIYPDQTAPAAPDAPDLTVVDGSGAFDTLTLLVDDDGSDETLSVGVGRYPVATSYTADELAEPVALSILLPPGRRLAGSCPSGVRCARVDGRVSVGLIILPKSRRDSRGEPIGSAFGSGAVRLRGTGLGWSSNGEESRAVFPSLETTGIPVRTFRVSYPVRGGARFQWSVPPVESTASHTDWELDVPNGRRVRVEATGSDPAAQSAESFALFMSGSLFALGTSALLALVPELVRLRHE